MSDIRAYFMDNRPHAIGQFVNRYATELFEADDKRGLLGQLGVTILPKNTTILLEELAATYGLRRI